ncbi:MAG TPA: multicopper oxidase domain-containing protein [Verrucomicrobiae bacterium]|jgi:FtsP/CotA-like multicopper oxidase with cupredoxin domain|nr:multicopper oxidase domain-containing protein [Verrucomicrobiae bacterium]
MKLKLSNHQSPLFLFALAAVFTLPVAAATVEYHLTIAEKEVNFTGKSRHAITVNGSIPAPTLTFHEGDLARIYVTNAMKKDASIHWHGVLVPNRMDGVPYVTFPPIKPGASFTYEFPIRQSGTYWYHSHTALHEQQGVYGALVFLPQAGEVNGDSDHAVVLSDWTDENPQEVLRWLKRGSEWPAIQRGNSQTVLGALLAGKEGDYWKRELLRMPPMDLSDVAYDRFLANGEPEHHIAARTNENVRLRIVDGSSSTFFYLQFAGGPLTIVSADGQEVEPVRKDRFLISVAETYDVLVRPPGPGAYELRATAQDGSAWASIWIGEGEKHFAPNMPHANLYNAMGKLKLKNIFAITPGGTMGMPNSEINAGKFDKPGVMGGTMTMEEMMGMKMKPGMKMEGMNMDDMPMNEMKMDDNMPMDGNMKMDGGTEMNGMKGMAMNSEPDPHNGQKHTWDFMPLGPDIGSRKPLTMDGMGARPSPPYKDLRSVKNTALSTNRPVREVRLTLEGDMERYVWSLNGKTLYASDSIKIQKGETVRFIMINRSMMHHPMHLHGHFFRVINGQDDYSPLKHTVDVPPMQTTVIEFAADEVGDWFFHCHLLYHLNSGMARVVHYDGFEPYPDTAAVRGKLYRDPYYFWGTADILNNMTQGYFELANTRNIFNLEWEAGWNNVPGTEVETTTLYERYFNRFFRLFGGLDTEGTVTTGPLDYDSDYNRGVFGLMYRLPLNIDSTVWVDTDGGARVRLSKSIPLTPRLMLGGEARYDTHDYWEERVHLDYLIYKNVAVIGQWHSTYGWGIGARIMF